MEPDIIELKREELYEQVWSQPMSKLAKIYGMSDVGLAKICRKHDIPVPGRGHWEKRTHGKPVRKNPLPISKGTNNGTIKIRKKEKPNVDLKKDPEVEAMIAFEVQNENRIKVKRTLHSPHPLIEETAFILREEPNVWDNPSCRRLRCLNMSASKQSLSRALRIADALVKTLEKRGFQVSASRMEDKSNKTTVTILGEKVEFKMREISERIKNTVPSGRGKSRLSFALLDERPEYDLRTTGRFLLQIDEYLDGKRKNWSDGKRVKLEDRLTEFVVGLINAAVVLRARSLKWERWEREKQEQQQRREEMERQRREKQARVQALIKAAEDWQRSHQIRNYLQAVRDLALEKYGQVAPGSKLCEWLVWAEQQADHIDPLVESPL